ncbi:PDK [Symbiodinium natans]|uniref:PDK protein n=1 Tax=Symbiodinium natans TaxID=878477 RepID=A0A812KQN9_9DINO|nr:PDK [Symbiodinium natans]
MAHRHSIYTYRLPRFEPYLKRIESEAREELPNSTSVGEELRLDESSSTVVAHPMVSRLFQEVPATPARQRRQAQFWSPREGTPAPSPKSSASSQSPASHRPGRPEERAAGRPVDADLQTEDAERCDGRYADSAEEAETEEEDPPPTTAPFQDQQARAPQQRGREERAPAKAPLLESHRGFSTSRRPEASGFDGRRGRSTSQRGRSVSHSEDSDCAARPAPRTTRREVRPESAPPAPRSWARPSPRAAPVTTRSGLPGRRTSALGVASRFRPGMGRLSSRTDNDNCRQM